MLKATTAALALVLVGSASQAQVTRTWDGDVSTDAFVAANWSGDTMPAPGDLAVIQLPGNNRLPVLSNNLSVGSLHVQANASITTGVYTLTVTDSAGLDVDASGSVVVNRPSTAGTLKVTGGGVHQIDGLVDVPGIFWIDSNNATFQGNGTIRLNNGAAKMYISDTLAATFKMRIEGKGAIEPQSGTATFVLSANATYAAVVDANVGGTLAFAAAMTVSDASANGVRPLFRASTSSSAKLQFNQDALSLVSDFEIRECSTIDVNNGSINTSGSLLPLEGYIIVDTGEYFELDGSFDTFNGPGTWHDGDC